MSVPFFLLFVIKNNIVVTCQGHPGVAIHKFLLHDFAFEINASWYRGYVFSIKTTSRQTIGCVAIETINNPL